MAKYLRKQINTSNTPYSNTIGEKVGIGNIWEVKSGEYVYIQAVNPIETDISYYSAPKKTEYYNNPECTGNSLGKLDQEYIAYKNMVGEEQVNYYILYNDSIKYYVSEVIDYTGTNSLKCYYCNTNLTQGNNYNRNGYIPISYLSDTENGYLPKEYETNVDKLPNDFLPVEQRSEPIKSISEYIEDEAKQFYYLADTSDRNASYDIKDIRSALGVFGLPYQFMPHVDIRVEDSNDYIVTNNRSPVTDELGLGYKWMRKIYNRMPLLLITPGRPKFMTHYNKQTKESVVEFLVGNKLKNYSKDQLSDMFEQEGRYYEFSADVATYYNFVNPMCRAASVYLGLENTTIAEDLDNPETPTPFYKVDWQSFTSTRLKSFQDLGSTGFIGFYINGFNQIQESFQNETTKSQAAGTVDGLSDSGRELNFLFGYGASALSIDSEFTSDVTTAIEEFKTNASKLTNKRNIFSNLINHVSTVASGGRLIFPQVWQNSSFSKSYSVDINLVSPDADKLSIYLNIIVPLMHLIALVAPRTRGNSTGGMNPNAYFDPFLVRAVYKSMFAIDTGIISSMSITKGGEGRWTVDGLPTSVTVSFTIQDLYQVFSISPTEITSKSAFDNKIHVGSDTYGNTALMDYIGTLCGVNIFEPDIVRGVNMWYLMNIKGRLSSLVKTDIWLGLENSMQNAVSDWWRRNLR